MRLRPILFSLLALPLLSACVNDSAVYEIGDGQEHSLTLVREQPYFWNNRVNLVLIVSRMPACLRRHELGSGTEKTRVDVWQAPSGAFVIRVGKRMYVTETQTCEGFAPLDAEPPGGLGEFKGSFRADDGKLVFAGEAAGGK